MKKTWLPIVLALLMLTPATVLAQQESGKVAVFPFQVFSGEPLGYLKTGLQEMIRTKLASQGVPVLDPAEVNRLLTDDTALDMTTARQLASKLGAEYAVFGSLTKIGTRVSLDTKVLDVMGIRRPQTVFVEGAGLDSVTELTDKVAQEAAVLVSGREQVAEIKVEGNKRIEAEAVKEAMKTKVGGPYSTLRLDEDIRALWKMGYFEDVRIKTDDSPKGKVVVVQVKEKPAIREIKILGNKEMDVGDIKTQIGIKTFAVYKPNEIKDAEQKIVKLYRDKGFYDVKVSSQVDTLESGDMAVTFSIDEGEKVYVKEIRFEGNDAFSSGTLEDEMTTKDKGWLTWILKDNILERETLDQDLERINDYYFNHGYMLAKVGQPDITRGDDGLIITIKINEGPRFKVSGIAISGEMIVPRDELLTKVQTKPGDWYSREGVRGDLARLTSFYADEGFAYVDVRPDISQNNQDHTVGLSFDITRGEKVYFENIIITGNDRTRDKVIRREIGAVEGDLFSSQVIRNANMRLRRLDYFEDVQITTTKGTTADKMDLNVEVKEKRTGQISFGTGYSTQDGFMVMGSIAESNLFGRGQRLELRGQLGGESSRYSVSFTEPWLFDYPISAGVDLYDWEREYIAYDKEAIGGRLRFGFPTPLAYTRWYLYYKYEEANISDVDDNAALVIQDQVGTHTTSSVRVSIRRDSRDNLFNPTGGSDNSVSVEYAGGPLGGTNAFVKVIGDTGWYMPLPFWEHIFVVHGRVGWMTEGTGGDLPMYEKFFLGGINTLRGFDYQSVSPKDPATGDPIGGENMALVNLEYRFPLLKAAGITGVVFYDTGNVWSEDDGYDLSDLRQSVGGGIRWLSPVGPLRLEYGYVLDPQPGDDESNWEFSIGGMF